MSIITVHYLQRHRQEATRRAKEMAYRRRVDLHEKSVCLR
ncbi:hypothetical protein FLM9_832 [Candidatus Synechococcus spongiarum]|uniref:Uncharacterized protein n=1 Tax=Candidatus Synechococcus spongiarum TaxID=431041 RepID=A0A170T9J2_9SYNE|nr:hypothetical protein FLM9_832 [Candidatus Synechococcus spongiarum]